MKSYLFKGLVVVLLSPFFCYSKVYLPPLTFQASKKILLNIYQENPVTFYCDCTFNSYGQIIKTSTLVPRNTPDNLLKLEWEHVVPASLLGRNLTCWNKHSCPIKVRSNRECCRKTSEIFNEMEANLYNLVPSIKLANRARSNYRPGIIIDKKNAQKVCSLFIDKKKRIIEPAGHLKGFFARTYLKMDNLYRLPLSDRDRLLLQQWDLIYPKDTWEIRRENILDNIYQYIH